MGRNGAIRAPWRIGIDVGGTFTDMALIDASQRQLVFKVPSVPADPGQGVVDVVRQAAAALDITVPDLLGGAANVIHGSTVATNTVLEGRGAKVGLLCTAGFRDTLEIRRGIRHDVWDHRTPFAPVLVPRHLRRPVRERINAAGDVVTRIIADDVRSAAALFVAEDVEAIAVCFLHAYANPDHEHAARRVLEEGLGDHSSAQWISLSSDVVPMIGEYERCSTTVVNAYLMPRVSSYLRSLSRRLGELGLGRPLLVQQSNGGAISIEQAAERPVNLVLSGPAAGTGALAYHARTTGANDLVSMEIGGTSTDVTVMNDGVVGVADILDIAGYTISIPTVDIHTVGAGGGTIAGVDSGGMMYVGPRGAGASPGPAAYGKGGTEPTVTDAHLVLGRLKSGTYAGGQVRLDATLAERAITERMATLLGLTVAEAAAGIVRLANQQMKQAVERISVQRGIDIRRHILVACGGAGPMHGVEVARALGVGTVLVPRRSGAFCAFGMLNADIRQDFVRPLLDRMAEGVLGRLGGAFADLEARGTDLLEREGFDASHRALIRELELRYVGQQWSVRVALAPTDGEAEVRRRFEDEYERLYGHIQPHGTIEVSALRLVARGRMPGVRPRRHRTTREPPAPAEHRPVYFEAIGGTARAAIYPQGSLRSGQEIDGPAIVEEATTTVVVGPGDVLTVDPFGDYLIRIGRPPR